MSLKRTLYLASLFLAFNLPVHSAEIAVFNFQDAWEGNKEPDFTIFAGKAPSVDENTDSDVSLLSNNGLTSGGYASFTLSDDAANTEIFSTSDTPDFGMNFGGANQTEATNYFSFTVSPVGGASISYGSLTLFTSAFGGSDVYNVELRAVIGDGEETVMGDIHEHTPGGQNNEAVHAVAFDFDDFASTEVTEWRVYVYNTDNVNWAIRFDDVTLLEPEAPIVKPKITAFSRTGDSISLTWESKPTESYTIRYSTDLRNWGGDLDDNVAADAGEETTKSYDLTVPGLTTEDDVFFRVEKE